MRNLTLALALIGVLAATSCRNVVISDPNEYYRTSQQKYGL